VGFLLLLAECFDDMRFVQCLWAFGGNIEAPQALRIQIEPRLKRLPIYKSAAGKVPQEKCRRRVGSGIRAGRRIRRIVEEHATPGKSPAAGPKA
jgi:hypothetical protein